LQAANFLVYACLNFVFIILQKKYFLNRYILVSARVANTKVPFITILLQLIIIYKHLLAEKIQLKKFINNSFAYTIY